MQVFVLTRQFEDTFDSMIAGVFTTEIGAKAMRDNLESQFPFDSFTIVERTLRV